MRKVVSSLLILTLIVLFAVTFYCSIKTEEVFKAQVAQLNQDYQGLLQVELGEYQRGLLLSNVQVSLLLKNQQPLPLTQQIRHFPWGVTIYTRLAAASPAAQELAELLPREDLQLLTDVDWTGAAQSSFVLPDIDYRTDSRHLTIKGLAFSCNLDQQTGRGKLNFQLGSLQLQDQQQTSILLSGLTLASQFVDQQGLPLGDGEFTLERLRVKNAAQPPVELNDLRYQAATRLDGNRFASDLRLSLAELTLVNEKFSAAELALAISGVDIAALQNLQQSAKQLQADLLGQEVDPLVLQLQLFGLYSQLFREGITLTLERLAVQADEGKLNGHGVLTLQDLSVAGGSPFSFNQLKADLQLDVDDSVFAALYRLLDSLQRQGGRAGQRAVLTEQAEQLAGALVQKGLLTRRTDGGYRSILSIDQGQAQVNGNPFRL